MYINKTLDIRNLIIFLILILTLENDSKTPRQLISMSIYQKYIFKGIRMFKC